MSYIVQVTDITGGYEFGARVVQHLYRRIGAEVDRW